MPLDQHPSSFIFQINDEAACLEDIYLSMFDRHLFWIGGTFSMIATSFLIIGFFRFKQLRSQPGDLILGVAISDFIVSMLWVLAATYPELVDNGTLCRVVGSFATIGGSGEFLYNVSFSLFLVFSLRNALKQAKIPKNAFHFVNITLSLIGIITLLRMGRIGRTSVGTCSVISPCRVSRLNYVFPGIPASYAIFGIFTYYYVKRNAPACDSVHKKRTDFLKYYLNYNLACTIIYTLITVTNLALASLLTNDHKETALMLKKFAWLGSIYNACKLSSPIVLTIIRFKDPMISKYMWKTVFFWKFSQRNSMENSLIPGEPDEIASAPTDQFVFVELSTRRKVELTYTLLSCVLYANKIAKNRGVSMARQTVDARIKNPYKHEKVYLIEEKDIVAELPSVKEELSRTKFSILSGTFKVYAPGFFSRFAKEDHNVVDIVQSLDFIANAEQIEKAGGGDGGKSGEFFFFSKDKRLIIKTIPDLELKMMMKILESYDQHYKDYPNSLIAKIYGVYTYENTDMGLKFNLILMRNICGFPSQYIERQYDMKGSKHDREVFKDKSVTVSEQDLKGKTLKDRDFEKFQRKLFLHSDTKKDFLAQVEADSDFLRRVELIDYSFMVYVVNKEKAKETMDMSQDSTALNPIASIENTEQPGVYYNMGIIDYLQPYNFQKAMEKWLKRIKMRNIKLDTSSQNPEIYSTRFKQFINRITATDTMESHTSLVL